MEEYLINDISTNQLSIDQFINLVFWCGYFIIYIILAIKKRQLWWNMVVGEDGIPQPIEAAMLIWFITTPFMMITSVGLSMYNEGIRAGWTFLEIIGSVAILGTAIKKKDPPKEKID